MASLAELLARDPDRVILMDGGTGSTLEDRGVYCRTPLWSSNSLTTPEGRAVNDRLHAEYLEAGAEILIANTHNASLENCALYLQEQGRLAEPEDLLRDLNAVAVESVRKAVPEGAPVVVAAGVGSPEGPYARETRLGDARIVAAHLRPQVEVLLGLGVDLLLFETLTTPEEIAAVRRIAEEIDLGPFGVGFTCGEDGRTLAGVPMAEAAKGFDLCFVQCTRYDLVERALGELEAGIRGVYANDGRVWEDMIWRGDRVTPEEYAEHALRWRDAGARIIGGCCGTDPEHVRRCRDVLSR